MRCTRRKLVVGCCWLDGGVPAKVVALQEQLKTRLARYTELKDEKTRIKEEMSRLKEEMRGLGQDEGLHAGLAQRVERFPVQVLVQVREVLDSFLSVKPLVRNLHRHQRNAVLRRCEQLRQAPGPPQHVLGEKQDHHPGGPHVVHERTKVDTRPPLNWTS